MNTFIRQKTDKNIKSNTSNKTKPSGVIISVSVSDRNDETYAGRVGHC